MATASWVLGIDLGTTNTAAVAFGPGRRGPVSIMHGRNQPVMPSVVSLKSPQFPLVGWLAKDMLLTDPLTTISGWKRFIGRLERSEYVQRHRGRFPFRIQADPNGVLGAVVNGVVVPFPHIAGMVLDQVRLQASAALRADVRDCVIAVPAHFANAQREAIKEAAVRAGLRVRSLINEPTAAALAFGVNQQLDARVLIFDLGGGTFDVSLLEVVDNVFDVKATRGDGFLGGIDFDRAIMRRLVDLTLQKHKVDLTEEPVVAQRVLNAAESAKCALSSDSQARILVPLVGHDRKGKKLDLEYVLTREELESLTAPLVERCVGIVEELLASVSIQKKDIDHVILVGGQSRMPLVHRRIKETLGIEPLGNLDPDTGIAHGAALVAKSGDSLADAILLDVLSVPIGVVFPGGRTDVVFPSNASLPVTRNVRIERPAADRDLPVGLWQGPDVTSPERQVLGVIRVPAALFQQGTDFQLEFRLTEALDLQVAFQSSVQKKPLLLEQQARRG